MTVVVTGHQPNLLYPMSVAEKARSADLFIICCGFQMVRHGWVNRQRLADNTPLLIPFDNRDRYAPIGKVRIADPTFRARKKLAKTLDMHFGQAVSEPFVAEILRPYQRLAALNIALNSLLFAALGITTQTVRQCDLESGVGSGPLVTDSQDDMPTISEQLAEMTAEVGGDVWLSGPSGRDYLDESPFRDRGIEVRYFEYLGDKNPTALEAIN